MRVGNNRAKYERILEVLEKLIELSDELPIIVEGKNDEKALRELGVKGKIYRISAGTPFYEFCEGVAGRHRDVILFTDTDSEGRKIARRFKGQMSQMGVRVNDRLRSDILGKLDTNQVEDMSGRFKRVKANFHKL